MRVWDLHPGYLSRQSLLGQHAEIHALATVISNGKKGYAAHPETLRFKGRIRRLRRSHDLTVLEMRLRGFKHSSPFPACSESGRNECADNGGEAFVDFPVKQVAILKAKYLEREQSGRIPLPKNGYEFWAHHKYSVMARGYDCYKEVQDDLREKKSCSLDESGELTEKILTIMELPVTEPALANVVDHLWGYFKREASNTERECYLWRRPRDLHALVWFFYDLAQKYKSSYLLHSTIFADFTEPTIRKENAGI